MLTYLIGGFIPRRVIRRISVTPLKSTSQADQLNPLMQVSTYGWFGVFPRSESTFKVPLNAIQPLSGYREGNKFMNIKIGKKPFVFYLEVFEAEFFLKEYFDHLVSISTAQKGVLSKK